MVDYWKDVIKQNLGSCHVFENFRSKVIVKTKTITNWKFNLKKITGYETKITTTQQ